MFYSEPNGTIRNTCLLLTLTQRFLHKAELSNKPRRIYCYGENNFWRLLTVDRMMDDSDSLNLNLNFSDRNDAEVQMQIPSLRREVRGEMEG